MPEERKAEKGNVEERSDERSREKKKGLTKKNKYTILIVVCAVVLILGISLPIGLIYGNANTTPSPFFDHFHQEQDYFIKISWDKVRGAGGYTYSYCYADAKNTDVATEEIKNGYTQNTTTFIARHKGMFSFRVRAEIIGENTEYSPWITMDVDAWILQKPIVTIDDNLTISWAKSEFKAEEKSYEVQGYAFNAYIDGVACYAADMKTTETSIVSNWLAKLDTTDKVMEYATSGVWQDISFSVKVKALSSTWFGGMELLKPDEPYDTLLAVYNDSDYAESEIIITESIYKSLKDAA